MGKANVPATMKDAMAQMSTDVNVGMNEVVSVFVAKYEDGLMNKKANLQADIKQTKRDLECIDGTLINSINKSDYEGKIVGLGIVAEVANISVQWEKSYYGPANCLNISININDTNGDDKRCASINRYVKFDAKFSADRKSLNEKLEEQNAELITVMNELKSVSRKERQIRGRIAEMKLENSGMSALVSNPELLKLVELQ